MLLLDTVFRDDLVCPVDAEFAGPRKVNTSFLLIFQIDKKKTTIEISVAEIGIELDGGLVASQGIDKL